MTHFNSSGSNINPHFYVCVNPDCPRGVPSWKDMGKPSGKKCTCGQETRETKSEPLS